MLMTVDLTELAGRINAAHQDCRKAFEASQEQAHKSLRAARAAGDLLNEAKLAVGRGWVKWLEAKCPDLGERTSYAYMQISREWEQLQSLPGFSQLNYSTALALLGKLNQPEPEPVEVVEGELIQPTPKPARFEEGQQAVVANSRNLYAGETIEIVNKRGQVLIGKTSRGEFPFLPGELRSVTPELQPAPKLLKPGLKEQNQVLRDLLGRVLSEATMSGPLRSEVEVALRT